MRWFLTAFLFSILIPHLDNFPGGNNVKYILPALAALIIPLSSRRIAVFPDRAVENIFFCVLIVGAAISLLVNRDPGSILYVLFMPVSYLLYNYIRRHKLTRNQVYLLAGFIMVTCAVPRFWSRGSLTGVYGNPNLLSPLLSFALMLIFSVRRGLPRWIKIAAFLACSVMVIMTNSRAGQLGYLIFIIAYFTQRYVVRRHLRLLSLLSIFAAIAGYLWMLNTEALFVIEAANDLTGSTKDANFSERDQLYDLFFNEAKTNPYGIGLGQSKNFASENFREAFSPHNTYLKIAVEGGWVFTLGTTLLFCYMFLRCKSVAATSFLVGFYIRGLFESATPFTISMTSALLFLPFYLNEFSIIQSGELPPVKAF